MNVHSLTLLLLSSALSLFLSCETAEKSQRRAEQALRIGEYAEAADAYKTAYRLTPATDKAARGRLAFLMGECYRRYGNSARALAAYRNAARYKNTDSTLLREEGAMMLLNGDYKNALSALKDYVAAHPEDFVALRAYSGAQEAPTRRAKGSLYTVKPAALFNNNRTDYAPSLLIEGKDRQLYFTTTRTAALGNQLSGITGLKNGDIYVAGVDEKGNWKRPEPVTPVNTPDDEGAVCFSPDGKTMYLTVCTTHPQYPRPARIYTSTRADASWSKPQPLELISDTLSNIAQPPTAVGFISFRTCPVGKGRPTFGVPNLKATKTRASSKISALNSIHRDVKCFPPSAPTAPSTSHPTDEEEWEDLTSFVPKKTP